MFSRLARTHPLWPLAALLAAEALAFGLTALFLGLTVTPLSLAAAAFVLVTGLLPAVLRPGPESLLAGCLGTVFAAFLLLPFDPPPHLLPPPSVAGEDLPAYLALRLVNGAALGPLTLHFTARFPRRSRLPDAWLRSAYGLTFVLLGAFFLAGSAPARAALFALMLALLTVLVLGGMYQLLRASRDAAPENRRVVQQARLILFSLLLANSGIFLRVFDWLFGFGHISYDMAVGTEIFLPLGMAYAILRHDLFGIDAALRRALAYATLSGLLLTLYLGLTVGLTAVLGRTMSPYRGVASVVALLAAAAAFGPLQRRVQGGIDRLLYPDRVNFQEAIAAGRAALSGVVRREEVIRLLTKEIPARIGAAWATLSLAPAPDVPGHPESEPAWNAQLIVGGASLGRYWLGPRRAGPSFDADEQAQLGGLVQQAALALAYADTIEALDALNRQLEARVAERTAQVLEQQRALAVYEERRRLARDLHDSVTQTLFSINLCARAARGLMYRDVEAAAEELRSLEESARQALDEMRALLAQLRHPPEGSVSAMWVDFGALLEEMCARFETQTALKVVLRRPSSLLLPGTAAKELLSVAQEALHNAAKHSGAAEALCTVRQEKDTLFLTVSDRGRGFDPRKVDSIDHFGLRGMSERVAALGGVLEVRAEPGEGTVVRVRVPLSALDGKGGSR